MGIFSIFAKLRFFLRAQMQCLFEDYTHFAVQSSTIKEAAIGPKIP